MDAYISVLFLTQSRKAAKWQRLLCFNFFDILSYVTKYQFFLCVLDPLRLCVKNLIVSEES